MEPFLPARDLLESIPGVNQIVAEIVIAETGGDMTQFPTPEQLASWAGVSPGANESAGKVKSSRTRPGNRYLKGALGVAALTALRSTTHTYFAAKYRRLAPTRGPMKALVAVEHSMLTAAWHMLQNGDYYRDLGADYYTRREPTKAKPVPLNNSKPSDIRSLSNPNSKQAKPHAKNLRGVTTRRGVSPCHLPAWSPAMVTLTFASVLQARFAPPWGGKIWRSARGLRRRMRSSTDGTVCADQRILVGCVPVDPDPSVVLRACASVWWWRAQ